MMWQSIVQNGVVRAGSMFKRNMAKLSVLALLLLLTGCTLQIQATPQATGEISVACGVA